MKLRMPQAHGNTPVVDGVPHVSMEDFKDLPPGVVNIEGRPYLPATLMPGLPEAACIVDGIPYLDIPAFSEFKSLHTPTGWYWCEFFGGSLEYRCFLVWEGLRRAELFQMEKFRRLLDNCMMPIYRHRGVQVRQDPSHAMPGFYIVSPDRAFKSTDSLELTEFIQMRFVDFEVGEAMSDLFGIKRIFKVNEERRVSYQNVHTWMLPIDELQPGVSIHDWNTLDYMIRYSSWRTHRDRIITYNKRLQDHLVSMELSERVDRLGRCLRERWLPGIDTSSRIPAPRIPADSPTAAIIYRNKGIVVRHGGVAIPGFYRVEAQEASAPLSRSESALLYLRMRFIEYHVRAAMRNVLEIPFAYKLQEGEDGNPCSPIDILPILDIDRHSRIYNFIVRDYLEEYGSRSGDPALIERGNGKMSAHLARISLVSMDNGLMEALAGLYSGWTDPKAT